MTSTCATNNRESIANDFSVWEVATVASNRVASIRVASIRFALIKVASIALLAFCCLGMASIAIGQEQEAEPNDLSFDDLVFEMEEDEIFDREMLTEEINSYNGTTIRLKGFIRPTTRQDGITKFIFVRDNKECCFGPGAALFDCVLVRLAEGESTEYTVRPITIHGEFLISEFHGPGDRVFAVYRMKNAIVE